MTVHYKPLSCCNPCRSTGKSHPSLHPFPILLRLMLLHTVLPSSLWKKLFCKTIVTWHREVALPQCYCLRCALQRQCLWSGSSSITRTHVFSQYRQGLPHKVTFVLSLGTRVTFTFGMSCCGSPKHTRLWSSEDSKAIASTISTLDICDTECIVNRDIATSTRYAHTNVSSLGGYVATNHFKSFIGNGNGNDRNGNDRDMLWT